MTIGYKVVMHKIIDRKAMLTSCCQHYLFPSKFVVEYKVNEFVYPTVANTKLFVFLSLRDAEAFVFSACMSNVSIWKCKVVNPQPLQPADVLYIEAFWKLVEQDEEVLTQDVEGSYGCDAVKLLEKVW